MQDNRCWHVPYAIGCDLKIIQNIFLLDGLGRYANVGLLALRVLTGAFLIYGVADNIVNSERMDEFSAFLQANGFAAPRLMAPLSIYTQLLCGIAFVLGFLTRWAGIVIVIHFIVAVVMVHWAQDFRGWWPAIVLVGIGFQYALTGAGVYSLDAYVRRGRVN